METKNIKPLEDFDWESFENDGKSTANIAEETKAYESTLNNVNDNEVIDGKAQFGVVVEVIRRTHFFFSLDTPLIRMMRLTASSN